LKPEKFYIGGAMKRTVLILIAFIMFAGNTFAEQKEDKIDREKEAKLYKIELHPKTPKTGIETGHVIAYGHYIKPPYEVTIEERPTPEWSKEQYGLTKSYYIFINGIQVIPQMSNPNIKISKRKTPLEVKEKYRKERKLFKKIKAEYRELEAKYGREKAIKKLIKFSKKQSLVEDATDDPPTIPKERRMGDFFVKIKGGVDEGYVGMSLWMPDYEPTDEDERAEAEKLKGMLEGSLKRGRLKFYGFSGSGRYTCAGFKVYEIKNILSRKDLSFEEKEKRLSKMVVSKQMLKSILYNFNPSEYPKNRNPRAK